MTNELHILKTSNLYYLIKIDLEGNYTYANDFYLKSFDLKNEDIIGINCSQFIMEQDHPIIETIKKCFESHGKSFNVKLRKPFKENFYKHTDWEFTLILDQNNNPYEIICVGYDSSKLTEIDDALTIKNLEVESINSKFKALFNTSSLGILLHDLDGNIKLANQAFYQMIDYENYTVKSKNVLDYIPPKHWENIKATLELIKKTKESTFKELEIIHANGTIVNVNINNLIIDDNNGEPLIWSVIKNITERTNHLKLLEKQNELLEQTALIAKLGGWEINLNPYKRSWTKEVYKIHDLDPETTANLDNALNYYHPDDRITLSKAQKLCAENGVSYDLELRLIFAKKINKWVRVTGKPNFVDGDIQSIKGTVQDITEKKKVEKTIFKQQTLLKEIYFMQSHTIRLPLANVLGLVDLLTLTMPELSDENQEILDKLKFSANQLDDVIRKVAKRQPKL
jgi:PAS domain S-box-containing protein